MIPLVAVGRFLLRREVIIGIAVLGLVAMCHQRDQALVAKGKALANTAIYKAENAALARYADSLRTAFRVDTVRLTKWQTEYRTQRDTLVLTDTVAVKEFVHVADSTVKACTAAVTTCSRALAAKDSLHEATSELWAKRLESATREHTEVKVRWAVIGLLFGVAATLLSTQ